MHATRACQPALTVPPRPRTAPSSRAAHRGVRYVLGEAAWSRLPLAVQARFADSAAAAAYTGRFEIVRASFTGRLLAFLCRLIGTPVAPFTGADIPAVVRVFADDEG